MDKQLEQKIRERAYELWMQHGSHPGRAEEYWFQAEQEVMREAGHQPAEDETGGMSAEAAETIAAPEAEDESQGTLDVSPAPLGMTSETAGEAQAAPTGAKTRKRKSSPAPAPSEEAEKTAETPKRRRSTRSP